MKGLYEAGPLLSAHSSVMSGEGRVCLVAEPGETPRYRVLFRPITHIVVMLSGSGIEAQLHAKAPRPSADLVAPESRLHSVVLGWIRENYGKAFPHREDDLLWRKRISMDVLPMGRHVSHVRAQTRPASKQ